jgi:choline dehydrogenase-like flavoprotein
MEHPHLYSRILLPINDSVLTNFYRARTVRGTRIQGAVALSEETLRREKTLGFAAFLRPWYIPGEESLEYITDALRRGRAPKDLLWNLKRVLLDVGKISEARCRRMLGTSRPAFWLHNRSEQSPNRESRVRLGDRRDALGQRTAVLDWRLNESDKRSLRRGHEILGMELGRAGLGRLRIEFDEGPSWPSDLGGGNHHMGTTRMHEDPKQGVVDANCRVRDLSNLYIAGSSVFPTVGFSNPTLTIVALSLRLAAHLRQSLGWS